MQFTDERIAEIRRVYELLGDKTATAKQLGVNRDTVIKYCSNLDAKKEKEISPKEAAQIDLQKIQHGRQFDGLRSKYSALLTEHEALQNLHNAAMGVKDSWRPVAPITAARKSVDGESTAVIVASDWHIEETVDPATVSHLNEFSLKIARERSERFWQNSLQLVEMARSRSKVDTIVVGLLGDFISGYIHEELMESNSLSPIEAIVYAGELIESGLKFLQTEGKFKRIIIPCSVGNHGRVSVRMKCSTSIENSFEFLLYYMLRKQLPELEWQLPTGYHNLLQVYDTRIRFHHGDDINFQGGVGGITIPLNKAISQWNKAKHADIDVLGHWHQRISARDFVLNGSLIGYGAYAVKIKATFERPQQSFFLIHPTRGRTVEAPIFVE